VSIGHYHVLAGKTNLLPSLTEDYNLELQYRKPFLDIWEDEKNHPELGPLSERMSLTPIRSLSGPSSG
jgi:hypothetical protein